MERSDSHIVEFSLDTIWNALARRAAVLVGAATALCAMIAGAPPSIASLRGAVAWIGVLAISHMFGFAFRDVVSEPHESEETSPASSE